MAEDSRREATELEHDRVRAVYESRDRRSIAGGGAKHRAGLRLQSERLSHVEALMADLLPSGERPRLLDVGCGSGMELAHWRAAGWQPEALAGVDLAAERVDIARARCPDVDIRLAAADALPFADASFDVATASMVLSSVGTMPVRRAIAGEMQRVVRPGGLLVVYDFVIRNPRNRDVTAMPLGRLRDVFAEPPIRSERVSPLIYAVALGELLGPRWAKLAMRFAPPTHRITVWRTPATEAS